MYLYFPFIHFTGNSTISSIRENRKLYRNDKQRADDLRLTIIKIESYEVRGEIGQKTKTNNKSFYSKKKRRTLLQGLITNSENKESFKNFLSN